MGKTNHTPGPWHIIEREGCHEIMGIESDYIADVFGTGDGPTADARLIAAAPDLLDALKEMLFNAEHGNGLEAHYRVNDRARAAIAKAEGDTDE